MIMKGIVERYVIYRDDHEKFEVTIRDMDTAERWVIHAKHELLPSIKAAFKAAYRPRTSGEEFRRLFTIKDIGFRSFIIDVRHLDGSLT